MDTPAIFTIDFSHDELAWLLYTLKMPPLIGMGRSLYPENTSEEVARARLQAGGLALQARGLLTLLPEGTLQVERLVIGVLGAYAFAEHAVITAIERPGGADGQTWVYYLGPDMALEYTSPQGGLHRFTIMTHDEVLLAMILDRLNLAYVPSDDFAPQVIPQEVLAQIITSVQEGDLEGGYQQLLDSQWDSGSADHLINVLDSCTRNAAITIVRTIGQGKERRLDAAENLGLLDSEMGLLGYTGTGSNGQVRVEAYSRETLRAFLQQALGLPTA